MLQDWDTLCISELQAAQQAAGHAAVLLSTYPLGYDGHGAAAAVPSSAPATLLCAKEFDACGVLRVQARWASTKLRKGCVLTAAQSASGLECLMRQPPYTSSGTSQPMARQQLLFVARGLFADRCWCPLLLCPAGP